MKKKELLELIQELRNRIELLECQMQGKQDRMVYLPSVWDYPPVELCLDGQPHEYPSPWMATVPPPCKKCGKQGQSFTVVCSSSGSSCSCQCTEEGTGKPDIKL